MLRGYIPCVQVDCIAIPVYSMMFRAGIKSMQPFETLCRFGDGAGVLTRTTGWRSCASQRWAKQMGPRNPPMPAERLGSVGRGVDLLQAQRKKAAVLADTGNRASSPTPHTERAGVDFFLLSLSRPHSIPLDDETGRRRSISTRAHSTANSYLQALLRQRAMNRLRF